MHELSDTKVELLIEGNSFTYPNPEPGEESQQTIFNEDFILLAFWSQRVDKELKFWSTENIYLGLHPAAPFIVANFEPSNFIIDFLINTYDSPIINLEKWQKNYSNKIALILIDESTNKIISIRTIHVITDLILALKIIVNQQKKDSSFQAERQLMILDEYNMQFISSEFMLNDIKQYGLKLFANRMNAEQNAFN